MRDSSINCNNIIIVQIYKVLFDVNNLVDINRLFTAFVDNPWFCDRVRNYIEVKLWVFFVLHKYT